MCELTPPENGELLHIGRKTTERMQPGTRFPAMVAENIYLVGHSIVTGKPFVIRRSDPYFQQVLVVTSGRGRVWFRGAWHDLEEGDVFLSPSHEAHSYHVLNSWEIVWCIFAGDTFVELQDGPLIRKANAPLWRCLILGLLEAVEQQHEPEQSLAHWVAILKIESQRLIDAGQPHILAPVWGHVKRNLSQTWTLDLLAQKANMNVETLRQHSWREHRMSPITYLTHLRMQHAADMLKYGLKVEYVARMVGYENPFTFSTAFKRVMGAPPSALKTGRNRCSAVSTINSEPPSFYTSQTPKLYNDRLAV